ncbi:MAG: ABC transporter ATP-binding protein [Firmicutes bacterium]|nr:ABC transporter ATP-binding protein [Bacillota bacterium]
MNTVMLQVKNIAYTFSSGGENVAAVDGVSFAVDSGDALGLVGESGSGKSTLGRCIAGLLLPHRGCILYDGQLIVGHTHTDIQLVFQDSSAALNPRMKVEALVEEGLIIQQQTMPKPERRARVKNMLQSVGLQAALLARFPHELSGGQRQRVALARTLILNPRLLILDEPVSSLDVTAGARLLALLNEVKAKHNIAYILISHDLAVIRQICQRVAVMYAGKLVEVGDVATVFSKPRHFYTKMLFAAHPVPDPTQRYIAQVRGEPADPTSFPSGCRFHPRCIVADERCRRVPPGFITLTKEHRVACHKALL